MLESKGNLAHWLGRLFGPTIQNNHYCYTDDHDGYAIVIELPQY